MTAVEFLESQYNFNKQLVKRDFEQAKEMEENQKGYTEGDMSAYASYILRNDVITPSQWYKIYRGQNK